MHMPALLNKYPGYTGISELPTGIYLYAGLADALIFWQDPTLVNRHKVKPYSLYLSNLLTLSGVIPPTLVPEAAEVPQSQLWSLDRFNISSFHYPPALRYMPTIRLYVGPPHIHRLLFLLQKLIRPAPGVFRTELISRAVTPAYR
jgi:hypothetical protein